MRRSYTILPDLIKIILWGAANGESGKRVPILLRVFLALLLAVVYMGLSALLFWVGFADRQTMLVVLGIVCLISVPMAMLLEIRAKKMS